MSPLRVGSSLALCIVAAAVTSAQPMSYWVWSRDTGIGPIVDLALDRAGQSLASLDNSGVVHIWSAQTGELLRTIPPGDDAVRRIAFDRTSGSLIVGTSSGAVRSVSAGGEMQQLIKHRRQITALATSPRGSIVASGDSEGSVRLWEAVSGGPAVELFIDRRRPHANDVIALGFTSENLLVSVGSDLEVITWDVSAKRDRRRTTLKSKDPWTTTVIAGASVDADGTQLALALRYTSAPKMTLVPDLRERPQKGRQPAAPPPPSLERTIRNVVARYSLATGESIAQLDIGNAVPDVLSLSPGGCFAILGAREDRQGVLQIRDLISFERSVDRRPLEQYITAITVDAETGLVAAGLPTGEIRVWRVSGVSRPDCDAYAKAPIDVPTRRLTLVPTRSEPLVQPGPARIAVLPFKVSNVEASYGESIAELITAYLANVPDVQLIERSRIREILEERRLIHYTNPQAAEIPPADQRVIGQALAADKLLLGRVSRFGDRTFQILTWLVAVSDGRPEGSVGVRCENCLEQDLPESVERLRERLTIPPPN